MKILVPEYKIQRAVDDLARSISKFEKRHGTGNPPVFLGVLNGAFMFLADLVKSMEIELQVDFIQTQSYEGQTHNGVTMIKHPKLDLSNKRVYIIEDIVDSGLTITSIKGFIATTYENTQVYVVSLIKRKDDTNNNIDFHALTIGDEWIYGYGLDDNETKRNYRNIYEKIT